MYFEFNLQIFGHIFTYFLICISLLAFYLYKKAPSNCVDKKQTIIIKLNISYRGCFRLAIPIDLMSLKFYSMPDMQDGYVFLSLRCHLNFARMIIKTITPNSELERKNHQELSVIANELSIWHYRVQSALLVASSALLALSSAPIPASSSNPHILFHLYYTGLLCNVLQLLASSIVLGILLSNHSRFVRKASKELLKTITIVKY